MKRVLFISVLSLFLSMLFMLSGCAKIQFAAKGKVQGERWIDWNELSRLSYGISMQEVMSVLGEPIISEHRGDIRELYLYYRYRVKHYQIAIGIDEPQYDPVTMYTSPTKTPTYVKSTGPSTGYDSVTIPLKLSFKFDPSSGKYTLYDWIDIGVKVTPAGK